MTQENKTARAMFLFLKLTQDGKLIWTAMDPSPDTMEDGNKVVRVMYVAKKDDRMLRLYHYRFRSYTDEDEWHWEDSIALEVSDPKGLSWWSFPRNRVIWDLYEAVKFKTTKVDEFIDNLFSQQ
ncbi:MAG TPA: hypothetical protein VN915_16795 [Elusimicrobiota bacterium]|nr:hypothetical protein [Elusimicrobiota bacterium]